MLASLGVEPLTTFRGYLTSVLWSSYFSLLFKLKQDTKLKQPHPYFFPIIWSLVRACKSHQRLVGLQYLMPGANSALGAGHHKGCIKFPFPSSWAKLSELHLSGDAAQDLFLHLCSQLFLPLPLTPPTLLSCFAAPWIFQMLWALHRLSIALLLLSTSSNPLLTEVFPLSPEP